LGPTNGATLTASDQKQYQELDRSLTKARWVALSVDGLRYWVFGESAPGIAGDHRARRRRRIARMS
jgi:hypothetical protein